MKHLLDKGAVALFFPLFRINSRSFYFLKFIDFGMIFRDFAMKMILGQFILIFYIFSDFISFIFELILVCIRDNAKRIIFSIKKGDIKEKHK